MMGRESERARRKRRAGPGSAGARRARRLGRACVGIACAALLAGAPGARAESPAAVIDDRGGAGVIDWSRGLAIARGAAAADLRARSPEVARVGAERRARQRASEALLALAARVPLAGDTEVGEVIEGDAEAAARLARAAGDPVAVDIDYGTDGSVVVRLGLPLEAIRAALAAPTPAPPGADEAVTGVVVRAGEVMEAPVLSVELAAGEESYAGPVVFSRAQTDDPRLGDAVAEGRAETFDKRILAVDLAPEVLARARDSGALVMVVLGP